MIGKILKLVLQGNLMVLAIYVTPMLLGPTMDVHAANGQCRWEGGIGGGQCEVEDCIGNGGRAQCSTPTGAPYTEAIEPYVGPDGWMYSVCEEGLPSIPAANRWCTAAGGDLQPSGACLNLPGPPQVLLENPTFTAIESRVQELTLNYAAISNCPVSIASDTGWGATLTYISCAAGGIDYIGGTEVRKLRRLVVHHGAPCNFDGTVTASMGRDVKCPTGYKMRQTANGPQCYKPAECCQARTQKPVSTITGTKYREEVDYTPGANGGLRLSRFYQSSGYFRAPDLGVNNGPLDTMLATDFWHHSYDTRLYPISSNAEVMAILVRPDGTIRIFDLAGKEVLNVPGAHSQLTATANGYDLTLANSDVERFDSSGKLVAIITRAGLATTLAYDGAGKLATVTDAFGHSLSFGYTDGLWTSVTLPDSSLIEYQYDNFRRPIRVAYPDGTDREYGYGDARNKWLLTSIIDESGNPYGSYEYDAEGRVTSEVHAGEQYSFTYNNGSTQVTDPSGATTDYSYTSSAGVLRKAAHSQPCYGCDGFSSRSFDAQGNVAATTDYNGNQTIYGYDLVRNLQTSRTEGYESDVERVIQTQWHPVHRLPTQVEEPGRTTIMAYDTSGNLLTKTVTDTGTSQSRVWTYTYNNVGQVLVVDGPRSDVSDVTTMTYHNCTTGAQCGQLATVTDPVLNVTTYLTYNAHGQPLTISDANSVVTTMTYDQRQRLASRETGGETTTFTYYPTGQLRRLTLPDLSYLEYSYDAGQRLTAIEDGQGNRMTYVLNNAGQRTIESVYDPSQTLARTRGWVYDTLGRVLSQIDAYNNSTAFTYDLNGNVETVTDPEQRLTTYGYDALGRQASLIDAMSGLVEYERSPQDELERVIDPRALSTSYENNGFGDLMQLNSPDTGTTNYTRTAEGQIHQVTDARGQTATYTYDAAGRVTQIAYSDQTIQLAYDQGTYGKGRLTQLTDASGSTHWVYDNLGRVTSKQQIIGAVTRTVGYGYNSAGQLSQLTTPSGQGVAYTYDNGRVQSIVVNGSTVLNNVLYTPFGPTTGWTWGNSTLTVREYDLNGRALTIDSNGLSTYQYYADGTIQSWSQDGVNPPAGLSGLTEFDVDNNSNQLTGSTGSEVRSYSYDATGNVLSDGTRTFTYNGAGRMISATKAGVTATYALNGLGQRVRKTVSGQARYFVYDEDGRLLGEYNAAGALIQETVWLEDIPVAVIKPNGLGVAVFYVHTDHLNTPRSITRPSDNMTVWRWNSDPFGTTLADEDPDGDSVTFTYGLRFPGQYFDMETGRHYNYFRDYDPSTGRYVQSDPIGLRGGLNTYAYVSLNPLSKVDPRGLIEWSGGYVSGGAGLGFGAALDYYDLKTKCINGKRGRVRFIGIGGQASIGPLPVSLSAGSVTFEDGLSEVNPDVFEGLYLKVSAEYGLGFGVGYAWIQAGGARSTLSLDNATYNGGGVANGVVVGAGIDGVVGYSHVTSKAVQNCCEDGK